MVIMKLKVKLIVKNVLQIVKNVIITDCALNVLTRNSIFLNAKVITNLLQLLLEMDKIIL